MDEYFKDVVMMKVDGGAWWE